MSNLPKLQPAPIRTEINDIESPDKTRITYNRIWQKWLSDLVAKNQELENRIATLEAK